MCDLQSVFATAHPVRTEAPVAYLEAELLTAHASRDTAVPRVLVMGRENIFIFKVSILHLIEA